MSNGYSAYGTCFRDAIQTMWTQHGEDKPFALDRGLSNTPESMKIRAVLEDALLVEKKQASVGLELVHFATIRTIYPMR